MGIRSVLYCGADRWLEEMACVEGLGSGRGSGRGSGAAHLLEGGLDQVGRNHVPADRTSRSTDEKSCTCRSQLC